MNTATSTATAGARALYNTVSYVLECYHSRLFPGATCLPYPAETFFKVVSSLQLTHADTRAICETVARACNKLVFTQGPEVSPEIYKVGFRADCSDFPGVPLGNTIEKLVLLDCLEIFSGILVLEKMKKTRSPLTA